MNEQSKKVIEMETFHKMVTLRRRNRHRQKTVEMPCQKCGAPFVGGIKARYCPECRREIHSDTAKKNNGFVQKGTEALAKYKAEKEGKKNENA